MIAIAVLKTKFKHDEVLVIIFNLYVELLDW